MNKIEGSRSEGCTGQVDNLESDGGRTGMKRVSVIEEV